MYDIIFEKISQESFPTGRNNVDRIKLVNAENLNIETK